MLVYTLKWDETAQNVTTALPVEPAVAQVHPSNPTLPLQQVRNRSCRWGRRELSVLPESMPSAQDRLTGNRGSEREKARDRERMFSRSCVAFLELAAKAQGQHDLAWQLSFGSRSRGARVNARCILDLSFSVASQSGGAAGRRSRTG